MFYVLSKLLDALLSPLAWALILFALAVPWRRQWARRWKRRRAAGAAGILVLLAFSNEQVDVAMMRGLEASARSTMRDGVIYDAVVLLGGVTDERVTALTGRPAYNGNVERLTETHRLLREDKARVVVISGAAVDASLAEVGEARVLARQLREWGIPEERIVIEERARNTRENAVYTAEIARARGFSRLLVVTSAFHMKRSLECFRAVGLEVDALPVDHRAYPVSVGLGSVLPRAGALFGTSSSFHEHFGRLIYRAKGYAEPLP